jgi:hypothetical protein
VVALCNGVLLLLLLACSIEDGFRKALGAWKPVVVVA